MNVRRLYAKFFVMSERKRYFKLTADTPDTALTFDAQIPMILEEVYSPNLIEYCAGNAKHKQDEEQHQNLGVGEFVHCWPLLQKINALVLDCKIQNFIAKSVTSPKGEVI